MVLEFIKTHSFIWLLQPHFLSILTPLLGLMSASIDNRLLKKKKHLLNRKWKAFDAEFLHDDIEII